METRTIVVTDGTQVPVRLVASGPCGIIQAPRTRPTLWLYAPEQERYYRVPETFTAADLPALEETIHGPPILGTP